MSSLNFAHLSKMDFLFGKDFLNLKPNMLSFVLQLQDNTVVVRPSMVKVKADPKLSWIQSLSSLEIVSTRYSGKLFVLLHFGCKYILSVFAHLNIWGFRIRLL